MQTSIDKIIEIYKRSELSISKFSSIIGKDRRTFTSWLDRAIKKEPPFEVKDAISTFFRYPQEIWNENCQGDEFIKLLTKIPQDEVRIIDMGYLGGLKYILEQESDKRLVIHPQFPGPVYRDSTVPRVYRTVNSSEIEEFKTIRKKKMLDDRFESIEWYSIKSLLFFCFSDIGNFYTKKQKIQILTIMIEKFKDNYNKALYFFDSYSRKIYGLDTAYTSIQAKKGTMFFKAPLESVFLEIRNKKLVDRIHRHFTFGSEAPNHVSPSESPNILIILKDAIETDKNLFDTYEAINEATNYGGLFYNNISLNLQAKLTKPKPNQKLK